MKLFNNTDIILLYKINNVKKRWHDKTVIEYLRSLCPSTLKVIGCKKEIWIIVGLSQFDIWWRWEGTSIFIWISEIYSFL